MEFNEEDIIYRSDKTRLIVVSSGREATEQEKKERLAKYVYALYEMNKENQNKK